MNRVNNGEWLDLIYYRNISRGEYETVGTHFKGRVLGDHERHQEQFIVGMLTQNSTMAIYCTNLSLEIKVNDMVEILGKRKLIDSCSIVMGGQKNMLGASRYSNQFIAERLPKILRLL